MEEKTTKNPRTYSVSRIGHIQFEPPELLTAKQAQWWLRVNAEPNLTECPQTPNSAGI